MFDEPHLGMDVPSRVAFYEELLADYAERPRTIMLSTHLIEEAASLFEDIVIIDRGRLVAHEAADDLRGRGAELVGPAAAVDAVVGGRRTGGERRLGTTKAVTLLEPLDEHDRAAARAAGVEVQPMPLQDLFIRLTEPEDALR
jgi:ABC-2 type transport system ATP-binding protein